MSVLTFSGSRRRLDAKTALAILTTLALLLSMQTWFAPAANAGIVKVRTLTASGTALRHPYAIATDDIGNVYVADTDNHRIVKFSQYGAQLLTFGQGPPAGQPGQLYFPEGVVFANDHIYVADTYNNDVKVFTTGGAYMGQFNAVQGNSFSHPDGIATDCAGNIYVANGYPPYLVQVFDPVGTFVRSFGQDVLSVPVGIAVNSYLADDGCQVVDVFVASESDGMIAEFSGDGTFDRWIGTPGTGPGHFSFPDQIALDLDFVNLRMTLWVAESGIGNERVQAITRDAFGTTWTTTAIITEGNGHLTQPHGVAVNQQGHIFVADTGGTSYVFEYKDADPVLHFRYVDYSRRFIKESSGLWFKLSYNQLLKTCKVLVKATVTVPPNAAHVFTEEAEGVVGNDPVKLKVDLSDRQLQWMKEAWSRGKQVSIAAKAIGKCSGDVRVTNTDRAKV